MVTISLCMIVKNEEDVLGRCLDCVKGLVDEINIVDTGSTDRTREIAGQYTDRVFNFQWIDDFSAARNYSFSKATKDYIMWLDADDVISEENQIAFKELKAELDPSTDVVMMKYNIGLDKDDRPGLSYFRERILKREKGFRWMDPIHEVISPSGNILHSEVAVSHKKMKTGDPARNLKIYQSMLRKGKKLNPRQRFYYARELYYNRKYEEAAAEFEKFLDEPAGWIENKINACQDLAKCRYFLGNKQEGLMALLRSFLLDSPRAEICCDIGKHFQEAGQFGTAAYWYEQAAAQTPDDSRGGFYNPDCYGYIPCIQLCVCYDRLGMREKARENNDKAGRYKPTDPSYLYNVQYFSSLDRCGNPDSDCMQTNQDILEVTT